MGQLWASAPGPRVSAAQAAALGSQVPAGAGVDRAADTITFTTPAVRLTMLASPSGGPDETFRAAGLTNPHIIVPAGAQVAIQVINADPDTAHGLVITASQAVTSPMPMLTARAAFTAQRSGSSVTPPQPGCTRARWPSPPPAREHTSTCARSPAMRKTA
jgi:hypothetical protein